MNTVTAPAEPVEAETPVEPDCDLTVDVTVTTEQSPYPPDDFDVHRFAWEMRRSGTGRNPTPGMYPGAGNGRYGAMNLRKWMRG